MISIGNFKIMPAFYNGCCLGLKTDVIYSLREDMQEQDKGHLAWILVLPFLEIYLFWD